MNRVLSNIYEGMGKSASGDKEKHGPAIEVGLVSQPNTPPRDNQMKEPDAPSFESKRELTMAEAKDATGFAFSDLKKWRILSVIFIIQCSMNMNASIYGNAVSGLKGEFSIDNQMARTGQAVFLIAYAFGCELWAPWSEEVCTCTNTSQGQVSNEHLVRPISHHAMVAFFGQYLPDPVRRREGLQSGNRGASPGRPLLCRWIRHSSSRRRYV